MRQRQRPRGAAQQAAGPLGSGEGGRRLHAGSSGAARMRCWRSLTASDAGRAARMGARAQGEPGASAGRAVHGRGHCRHRVMPAAFLGRRRSSFEFQHCQIRDSLS